MADIKKNVNEKGMIKEKTSIADLVTDSLSLQDLTDIKLFSKKSLKQVLDSFFTKKLIKIIFFSQIQFYQNLRKKICPF